MFVMSSMRWLCGCSVEPAEVGTLGCPGFPRSSPLALALRTDLSWGYQDGDKPADWSKEESEPKALEGTVVVGPYQEPNASRQSSADKKNEKPHGSFSVICLAARKSINVAFGSPRQGLHRVRARSPKVVA